MNSGPDFSENSGPDPLQFFLISKLFQVTNKSAKGKYKFLQKYYHRGVFYLDEEDARLKRDFTAPTLEDNFNKSVLPKVGLRHNRVKEPHK